MNKHPANNGKVMLSIWVEAPLRDYVRARAMEAKQPVSEWAGNALMKAVQSSCSGPNGGARIELEQMQVKLGQMQVLARSVIETRRAALDHESGDEHAAAMDALATAVGL
jgi:hypothetical protein